MNEFNSLYYEQHALDLIHAYGSTVNKHVRNTVEFDWDLSTLLRKYNCFSELRRECDPKLSGYTEQVLCLRRTGTDS